MHSENGTPKKELEDRPAPAQVALVHAAHVPGRQAPALEGLGAGKHELHVRDLPDVPFAEVPIEHVETSQPIASSEG